MPMAREFKSILQIARLTNSLVVTGVLLLSEATAICGGSFSEDRALLDKQELPKVGRDALVKGYEQLLHDYPDAPAPQRGEVMLRLTELWQNTNPKRNEKPNYEKCMYWLRKACSAFPEGSPEWFEANFRLEGQIYSSWLEGHLSSREKPDECRRILHMLIEKSPDLRYEAHAYYELQRIAQTQKDIAEAERICMKLQSLDLESDRMSKGIPLGNADVYGWIQDSERSMMMTWAEMTHVPREEREAKINAFAEKAHLRMHIHQDRASALQYLTLLEGPAAPFRASGNVTARPPAGLRPTTLDLHITALKNVIVPVSKQLTNGLTDVLELPIRIENRSAQTISANIAHEWHGGRWPSTDLGAAMCRLEDIPLDDVKWRASEVYLSGELGSKEATTVWKPGESHDFVLRMNWPGTGSVHSQPPIDANAPGKYAVRVSLIFRAGELHRWGFLTPQYIVSPVMEIEVRAKPPAQVGNVSAPDLTLSKAKTAAELLREFKNERLYRKQGQIGERLIALKDKSIVPELAQMLTSESRAVRCNAGCPWGRARQKKYGVRPDESLPTRHPEETD